MSHGDKPESITALHLRALMAATPRSVLLRTPSGGLTYSAPTPAFEHLLAGCRLVITRSLLADAGVRTTRDGTLAPGGPAAIRHALRSLADDGHSVAEDGTPENPSPEPAEDVTERSNS